jgi:hypothetical protein
MLVMLITTGRPQMLNEEKLDLTEKFMLENKEKRQVFS